MEKTIQRSWLLGVYPGLAGFFLMPPLQDDAYAIDSNIREKLLQGYLPEALPRSWRFLKLAVEGKTAEEVFEAMPEGPERQYNLFILDPTVENLNLARSVWKEERSDERVLLETVAWGWQFNDRPPVLHDPLPAPEIVAFYQATRGYAAFSEGDSLLAALLLKDAAEIAFKTSPVFAARLYAESAQMFEKVLDHPPSPTFTPTNRQASSDFNDLYHGQAIKDAYKRFTDDTDMLTDENRKRVAEEVEHCYRTVLDLLKPTAFRGMRAEIWVQFGSFLQSHASISRVGLQKAMQCYHEGLKEIDRNLQPETFAIAHMNLAIAYLSLPQHEERHLLRAALAVQSLRQALNVLNYDEHPDLWASVTTNLANAIQHVRSAHVEDNLWEAVSLYEEVLSKPIAQVDPLRKARLLANQGNALAHLGAFSRAVPRLKEAHALFMRFDCREEAGAVMDTLEEIERLRHHDHTDQDKGGLHVSP
ncbi:MAG: hypothetical protein BSOLF_1534 [Candidatus Carbobacillus altaicus]|uniref:Tetratricopeptide repeat protein n=1 Tax=Candidatus Carbonibacillus altaicus TaxID=2163959 RepID=A0A2R6XZ76_9BACL|nr:MAG: hypothetical protein BSOLF_1534 [Candidatus Carbobacillus altaicus]